MPRYRNKITGEIIDVPDGPQMPMNPTYPYQGPQAAADLSKTQVSNARTSQQMRQDDQMFPINKRLAELEAASRADKLNQDRLAQEAAQREAEAKDPFNSDRLQSVQQEAMQQLQTIGRIGKNYSGSILPAIGTGAETVKSWMGGTAANNIAADAESLQSAGAMQRIMKMAADNGGKNPLTPMSNSDVAMLARGIGNLDQSQSPDNYFANLNAYGGAAKRAYAGAVGMSTLKQEMDRQYQKYVRENPRATPGQRNTFLQTLKAQMPQQYDMRMKQRQAVRGAPRVQDRNNDGIPDDVRGILGKYGVR